MTPRSDQLAEALEEAIAGADAVAIAQLIVGASESERRAAATSVWFDDGPFISEFVEAARSFARLGCDVPKSLATEVGYLDSIDLIDTALVATVARARGDRFTRELADWLGRPRSRSLAGWQTLRALIREGLASRPDRVWWAEQMPWAVVPSDCPWDAVDGAYQGILRDPRLLEEDVWLLFEVDCGEFLADACVRVGDRDPGVKLAVGPNLWFYAFIQLVGDGRIDAYRLATAARLAHDRWPDRPWYRDFVELLAAV